MHPVYLNVLFTPAATVTVVPVGQRPPHAAHVPVHARRTVFYDCALRSRRARAGLGLLLQRGVRAGRPPVRAR